MGLRKIKINFNLLKIEWSYTWQEIDPPPLMVDKGVQICIKDGRKKKTLGGLFGSSDTIKVVYLPDLQTKQVNLVVSYFYKSTAHSLYNNF